MKHAWMYALALVAVLSACHSGEETLPAVDLSGLEEIRIDFERTGWGSVEEHFTITPTAGGIFVLRGRYETRQGSGVDVEMPLASNKVADFVREASSPGWTRQRGVQVLAQGVDQRAWRKFDAVIRVPPAPCSDEELQHLARRHFGRTGLLALVDEHYGHGISWTDDYPHALIQMRWRGRPTFMIWSNSQKARMLPWHPGMPVDSPQEADQNWSLPLSASLQALLPPQSFTYGRLGGADMEERLNRNAIYKAERQCEALRGGSDASAGSHR
ncbi:hypothetical protein [Pseudoxanthomonas sp.]|uniref:hypothetical protein n=1 Tax=Pseudoxanthomonas sp. TaxID=1871049 RepID=UPI0025E6FD02|nr:hypothetical protein [Pseudoxanthomonas sp.]